jgi:hypothetical protein
MQEMQFLNLRQPHGAPAGTQIDSPTKASLGTQGVFPVPQEFQNHIDSSESAEGLNLRSAPLEVPIDSGLEARFASTLVSKETIIDGAPQDQSLVLVDIQDITASSPEGAKKFLIEAGLIPTPLPVPEEKAQPLIEASPEQLGAKSEASEIQPADVDADYPSMEFIVPLMAAHQMLTEVPIVALSGGITGTTSEQNQLSLEVGDAQINPESTPRAIEMNALSTTTLKEPIIDGADVVMPLGIQISALETHIAPIANTPPSRDAGLSLLDVDSVETHNQTANNSTYVSPSQQSSLSPDQGLQSLAKLTTPIGTEGATGSSSASTSQAEPKNHIPQSNSAPSPLMTATPLSAQTQSTPPTTMGDPLMDPDSPPVESSTLPTVTPSNDAKIEPKSTTTAAERGAALYSSTADGAPAQLGLEGALNTKGIEVPSLYGVFEGAAAQVDQIPQFDQLTQTTRVELPARLAAQIADVARYLPDGPIEISLSPEELGKVRLTFQVSEGGAMNVVVAAERADTLEFMRRNVDSLLAEFSDLGYEGSSFQFQQDSQNSSQDNSGRPEATVSSKIEDDVGTPEIKLNTPTPARLRLDVPTSLDLKM